ncbi:MAG TPA: FAD-dependent oxidoreductase, partial [Candidatus Elarobacter sp.]
MRYDLAVVGSGQGGVPLALDFAKSGKRVVLFERGDLGGCCVNVGCTPSKAFLASAHMAGRARRASDVHVHCDVRADVPAIMDRVRRTVGDWRAGVEGHFEKSSCELVRAEASFEAPYVLRAGGTVYEADVVVLDTGSRANVPPLDGLTGTPYLTNENFFLQETLPKKLIVLGSGYVGLELGQGAARLGCDVTVVTPDDRIVAREELDVCSVLTKSFERDGIRVLLNHRASKVAHDAGTFTVTLDDGTTLTGDGLLVAVGRAPNIPDGTTDRAGIALDKRGFIACDEHLQTSVAHHYALGDVAGQPQFTHVAWEDFRRLR